MVIIPLYVKNQDELKKATSLKRNVIVITDGDLFQEVQKNKKKYKVKKGIGKFGILGSIGIFTAGLFAPEVVVPLVIAGSVGSLTAGVWGNFSAFLHKELKNYTLSLDEKNRVLLLINEKEIKIKYDGNISIEGCGKLNEKAKIIAPVYVNNLEDLKFNVHEERECIIVESDLYKKIKTESKSGPSFFHYEVYDSKKNMQRIYINRKKCDLETCKIEGVDMNSILLGEVYGGNSKAV